MQPEFTIRLVRDPDALCVPGFGTTAAARSMFQFIRSSAELQYVECYIIASRSLDAVDPWEDLSFLELAIRLPDRTAMHTFMRILSPMLSLHCLKAQVGGRTAVVANLTASATQ